MLQKTPNAQNKILSNCPVLQEVKYVKLFWIFFVLTYYIGFILTSQRRSGVCFKMISQWPPSDYPLILITEEFQNL